MAVYIQNISKERNQIYGKGIQTYILGINDKKFIEFEHEFEKGLVSCLRCAATALETLEKNNLPKIYELELRTRFLTTLLEN